MFYAYPRTFWTTAHHEEPFVTYKGSGRSLLDSGRLAAVLRARLAAPVHIEKRAAPSYKVQPWGEGTRPYAAESLGELHRTIQLRKAR